MGLSCIPNQDQIPVVAFSVGLGLLPPSYGSKIIGPVG